MGLFDRVTNKIKSFQRATGEIGGTGTQVWDGTIVDEEYKSALNTEYGQEGLTIFNRMRKSDPVIRASLKAIELKIRQGNWFVEPADDSSEAKKIAEFVDDAIFERMSTPWAEVIRLILTMLPFGFSVFEKVFKEEEGNIYWDKWAFRSQKSIEKFQLKNGGKGITQQLYGDLAGSGGTNPEIPIERLLIFTHEKEGDNWRGVSVLRSAYKPWFFKEALEKIESIGYERQAVGIPTATIPPNARPEDTSKVEALLKNVRANEKAFIMSPEGYNVAMLDMKGNSTKDPSEAIQRKNWEIAVNVLAPHITLGQGKTGSFALAKQLSTDFSNSIQSYAEEIADVINAHAIKQLVDLNFGEQEAYPKLNVTGITEIETDKMATAVQALAGAGFLIPDNGTEDYLREILGMPEKEEGAEKAGDFLKKQEDKKEEDLGVKDDKEVKKEKEDNKDIQASEHYGKTFWRPLTAAERNIDLKKVEGAMDKMEGEFKKQITDLAEQERIRILAFAEQVAELGDPSLFNNYAPQFKDEIADEIYSLYVRAFERGKILAANELNLQAPETKSIYLNSARARAVAVADKMVNDLVSETGLALTDLMEKGVVRRTLVKSLGEITIAKLTTIIARASSATMIGGINTGRFSVFEGRPEVIYSLQRSELLDNKTCNFCLSIDGRSVYPGDDLVEIEQFHHHCRGIWVAIHKDEADKPEVTDVPQDIRERVGTLSEFKQMKNPRPLRDSLASDFIKSKK